MLRQVSHMLAADVFPQAFEKTWKFFTDGGFFMILIVACSLVALAVILYKAITLTKSVVLPEPLAGEVERAESGNLQSLRGEFQEGESTLARLCDVAMKNADQPQAVTQEAVQAVAKEEVVRMHAGLAVLDVVITVAPLLGLLGTASGLVLIFGNTEDLTSGVNNAKIGSGIARALGTTIAGMVVAVPSVVAHSYFARKIETMSARLEVLLGLVISVSRRGGAAEHPPAQQGSPAPLPSPLTQLPQ